jgi:triacylglycerol lipase
MSTAAHYIGRVGALAVALAGGIALANTPVASAEPTDSSASTSANASSSSSSQHSSAMSPDASAISSSTLTETGRPRGRLNAPGRTALSTSGSLTSSAASTPTGRALDGEAGRTRSRASGVVVATRSRHTGSSADSSEAADSPAAPSSDTTQAIGADAGVRSSSTAVIGRSETDSAATAMGSVSAKAAEPATAATAAANDATAQASSLDANRVVAHVAEPSVLTSSPDPSTVTVSASTAMFLSAEDVMTPTVTQPPTATNQSALQPRSAIGSTLVGLLLPSADNAPTTPAEAPTLWTLLAYVRREFEQAISNPNVKPLAERPVTEILTDTGVVTSPLIDPAITSDVRAPGQAPTAQVATASLDITTAPAVFTGEPSTVSRLFTVFYRVVGAVANFLDVDLTTPLGRLLSSDRPPWFTTLGLNVQRGQFEGMPVWTLQSKGATSEKTVVAVPGSAFVWPPTIFHWLDYALMARETGATVAVPIYHLVSQGGTAETIVPAVADLISSQIDQHGAQNVSVYGDSLGGAIGLSAVQELVRRGAPVPSHMVLISPALDLTFSNPAIQLVDDPVFSGVFFSNVQKNAHLWAGDLNLSDPLVSPLFGSLAGLPPTALYFGSREIFALDGLALQDTALATPGADFSFILRNGELHIWAVNTILPETRAVLPDIYQQLGIAH